jgi:cytochrome b involved in lipid metabolism
MNPSITEARENRIKFLISKNALKSYTLEEVKKHIKRDDGWIIVDGYVYDITAHVINHMGWTAGAGKSSPHSLLP